MRCRGNLAGVGNGFNVVLRDMMRARIDAMALDIYKLAESCIHLENTVTIYRICQEGG